MRTITGASALLLGLLAAGCNGELVAGGQRPAEVLVVSGDLQTGTVGEELPQPLVVRVVDDAGRPVRDQLVNFVVTAGGGSVFAGAAITNEDGEARERWTLGTVSGDTQRVEARAVDPETGAAVVFATFRAIGTAAAAASISAVQPTMSGAPGTPLADSAAALVRDPYGNPVPGVTVNWTVTSGGGSVSPATSVTNPQGIARTRWTLGGTLLAPHTLQASAGGGLTAAFSANAVLGAGAVLAKVSGDAQTGAVWTEMGQPLVVELRQNGVPVQGAQIQWTTTSGTVSGLTSGATATDAQGRTSVRWTPGERAGAHTVTAQVQGATVTFTASVVPGPPVRVDPERTFDGQFDTGHSLNATFTVVDTYGNPVPGVTLTFAVTEGASVASPTATTGAAGTATVRWTLPANLHGELFVRSRITATAPGIAKPGSREVNTISVATALVISPDVKTVAPGVWANYGVEFEDAFGNRFTVRGNRECAVVWSAPAPVNVNPQGGLFYPGVNVDAPTPGTYTITATCGALSDTATLIIQ